MEKTRKSNFDTKMFFVALCVFATLFLVIIANKIISSERSLIPISVIALISGVFYESIRITDNLKTVFYIALGALIFSFFAFMPGKHENVYNFESHIRMWPYVFIFAFIFASLFFNEKKVAPKLTEGVSLIQSMAVLYWVIDFGVLSTNSLILIVLLVLGAILSLFSILNAFTYIKITRGSRLILSLWCSLIMVLFAADNIYNVYYSGEVETANNLEQGLIIGLNYFLLGVCGIYIVQNLLMVIGFLPGKGRFFNDLYFREVKELINEHIDRFSDNQVNILDSIFCVLIIGGFFVSNYYYNFLSRNIAIWVAIVVLPYLFFIINLLKHRKTKESEI